MSYMTRSRTKAAASRKERKSPTRDDDRRSGERRRTRKTPVRYRTPPRRISVADAASSPLIFNESAEAQTEPFCPKESIAEIVKYYVEQGAAEDEIWDKIVGNVTEQMFEHFPRKYDDEATSEPSRELSFHVQDTPSEDFTSVDAQTTGDKWVSSSANSRTPFADYSSHPEIQSPECDLDTTFTFDSPVDRSLIDGIARPRVPTVPTDAMSISPVDNDETISPSERTENDTSLVTGKDLSAIETAEMFSRMSMANVVTLSPKNNSIIAAGMATELENNSSNRMPENEASDIDTADMFNRPSQTKGSTVSASATVSSFVLAVTPSETELASPLDTTNVSKNGDSTGTRSFFADSESSPAPNADRNKVACRKRCRHMVVPPNDSSSISTPPDQLDQDTANPMEISSMLGRLTVTGQVSKHLDKSMAIPIVEDSNVIEDLEVTANPVPTSGRQTSRMTRAALAQEQSATPTRPQELEESVVCLGSVNRRGTIWLGNADDTDEEDN